MLSYCLPLEKESSVRVTTTLNICVDKKGPLSCSDCHGCITSLSCGGAGVKRNVGQGAMGSAGGGSQHEGNVRKGK